ncbi:MAG: NAD-dependent malic enzyme [Opitutales bacterium]
MMSSPQGSPGITFSFTVRVSYPNRVGFLAKITQRISRAGGDIGAVDMISSDHKRMTRDITVQARDEEHVEAILESLEKINEVEVLHFSDQVFLLHLGGKISIKNKVPLTTREILSMVYTPGVARVCQAIASDPENAYRLTIKGNSVAVVTDGTAVLGLGDIGPAAALPVMEGKAMLFKEFANIDAYPICLDTKDADEIVETVARLAPGFSGINLEDISAPRCFEIEEKLQKILDIPVFHDDQHGTAIVVLAALLNALKISGKKMNEIRILVLGSGAAGVAITKILLSGGAKDIIVCDRQGALYPGRMPELNSSKRWLAENTNPEGVKGDVEAAARGADVFIGVSGPGLFSMKAVEQMAPDPVIFALANPIPEIMPEEVAGHASIVATGRSDYPNQINNVLAFPGIFRGALDVRARNITEEMKVAAAEAIASCVPEEALNPEYIVPSVFDRNVAKKVAEAVAAAAVDSDVARKQPK